jgi:hypothetical protein
VVAKREPSQGVVTPASQAQRAKASRLRSYHLCITKLCGRCQASEHRPDTALWLSCVPSEPAGPTEMLTWKPCLFDCGDDRAAAARTFNLLEGNPCYQYRIVLRTVIQTKSPQITLACQDLETSWLCSRSSREWILQCLFLRP